MSIFMERYTKPVINWPLELTDGDCGYLVPRGAAHKADERVITYAWIGHYLVRFIGACFLSILCLCPKAVGC